MCKKQRKEDSNEAIKMAKILAKMHNVDYVVYYIEKDVFTNKGCYDILPKKYAEENGIKYIFSTDV